MHYVRKKLKIHQNSVLIIYNYKYYINESLIHSFDLF